MLPQKLQQAAQPDCLLPEVLSRMARARLRVITPDLSVGRSGCSSSTVRASSPNSSTIRRAGGGFAESPRTAPEAG
ncbi:MAG: hypothetical protein ACLRWQ_21470 [Flavonifractor plautii]